MRAGSKPPPPEQAELASPSPCGPLRPREPAAPQWTSLTPAPPSAWPAARAESSHKECRPCSGSYPGPSSLMSTPGGRPAWAYSLSASGCACSQQDPKQCLPICRHSEGGTHTAEILRGQLCATPHRLRRPAEGWEPALGTKLGANYLPHSATNTHPGLE